MSRQICQQCGKQALYSCGQCQVAVYCSQEHQLEHWRIHKEHCNLFKHNKISLEEDKVTKKRLELRSKYFQNYMHKMYDICVKLAEQMLNLEKNHIKTTREIVNQLEYGISVCLFARSKLNLKNQLEALLILKVYLNEKMHFLQDLNDIYSVADSDKHGKLTTVKQFSVKKVSLLASIANIAQKVKLPILMKLYHIYTDHVSKIFGQQSVEVSNCYFMIGSYYVQNLSYHKAIACFLRAVQLRGNKAGDCYYNLGIIFKILKKDKIAIQMFENAAKMRQIQFGQNAGEVADVYHNIALLHQSCFNYEMAIKNFEKIVLIYSKNKNSADYHHAKESIKTLQQSLKTQMQKKSPLDPTKYGDLKETLKLFRKGDGGEKISDHDFIADYNYDNNKSEGKKLKLPDQFLKKLNPRQLFHLSELQLEIQPYTSEFMVASALGSSKFLKILPPHKIVELQSFNLGLFKHISIQKLDDNKGGHENEQG